MNQKGFALLIPLFILVMLFAVIFALFVLGIIKNPLQKTLQNLSTGKEASVTLKTEYSNPFETSSQYVNPFSTYKNPFDNLK